MADLRLPEPLQCSFGVPGHCLKPLLATMVVLLACSQILFGALGTPNSIYSKIASIRRSDPDEALAEAEQAYKNFRHADVETAWRFRLLYADLLLDGRRTEEAAALLRDDLPQTLKASFAARLAVSRVHLASKGDDFSLTEKRYKQALALLPTAHDPCLDAELSAIGIQNLIYQDKLPEAAKRLVDMESSIRSCPDPYWTAIRLYLTGTQLLAKFQTEEALQSFTNALSISRSHNLRQLVSPLLGNLASCQLFLGDTPAALRSLDDAEHYRGKGQVFDRSIDHGRRGLIYTLLRQNDKAESEYKEALSGAREAKFRPFQVRWLNELSSLACDSGNLSAATSFSELSLRTADPKQDKDEYRAALLSKARIARLRQDLAGASRILVLLASYKLSDSLRWEYQAELAQLQTATNQIAKAKQSFRRAIETAESARRGVTDLWYRMTFSARLLDLYRRDIDFLINHGEKDEALEVVESFHARQLLERLNSKQKVGLVSNFSRLAIAQRAVILSYWVGNERSYMWITTDKGSKMFPLGDLRRLEFQIRDYRNELENISNPLHNSTSSTTLYRELISKAAPLIRDGSHVIVIPDGPLADLNFETLISSDKPGHYWLETVSVRVAPSLMLLHTREPEKVEIPTLLLVGGTKPPTEFPVLPGSQQEIKDIDYLFHSRSPLVLSGDNATPEKFLAADPGRFSLIHLSAHAIAVKENPLDSAIILTPNKRNGNFKVYARQLSSMKLHAELVTLSACRGAGAQAVPGEGLVGLTWAFMSAGAHNVVAGLWDVPDKASAELMEGFYSRLQKGESPGAALRSAKLEMCSHKAPPYYWAAFQLYTR